MAEPQAVGVGGWLQGRRRSFAFAFQGMRRLWREPNTRIHSAAAVLVVNAGLLVGLSSAEWCWIVLSISAVFAAEAFNTALELLCDAAVPTRHPLVGAAKDVAACAVLISALGAVVIAALIFVPRLAHWLG